MTEADKEAFIEALLVQAHRFWELHTSGRMVDLQVFGGRHAREDYQLLVPRIDLRERWEMT